MYSSYFLRAGSKSGSPARMIPPLQPTTLLLSGLALCLASFSTLLQAQPAVFYDLATKPPAADQLTRVHGSVGSGFFGVPVSQPGDADGDGNMDYALGFMRASPLGRANANEVNLILGSGHLGEIIDTASQTPRVIRIAGEDRSEATGDEIWFGDVNGDGFSDLLIGRQNFSPTPDRHGGGALSIVFGTPRLREFATRLEYLDLGSPPPGIQVITIRGRAIGDRLGIWMRTGDIDGDGIDDILVGADQEEESGSNSGAGYVIRGGDHFAASEVIDLDATQGTVLEGNVTRLIPPPGSSGFHLGATCFVADLDGNGRAETLLAAALSRAGASILPNSPVGATWQASGGAPGGRLYIAWDDNFPQAPWPAELQFGNLPGSESVISGGPGNRIFGEEIIGGADFNGNGQADLFVGDFFADETGLSLAVSGAGYVLYEAAQVKGESFAINAPPDGLTISIIAGPSRGAIGADTATAADFDGDGFDDLAFGSPHHDTQGRDSNGAIHVFFGQAATWPAFMSTVPGQIPAPALVRVTEVQGALGREGSDLGDTLSYSASSGDVDGDGFADLLSNEMLGNGLAPGTEDVGNLIIISGSDLARRSLLDFAQIGNGDEFFSRVELVHCPESSRC